VSDKKHVHVAVGVISNALGDIFIAKRADHLHQGGLWEFPGGKVEAGETVTDALARELREELAIDVLQTSPLIQIRHDYGDKAVLLDVHRVASFVGEPIGAEGQLVRWVPVNELSCYQFPAANIPIIKAIELPTAWAITGSFSSPADFIARFRPLLATPTLGVIVRIPGFSVSSYQPLLQDILQCVDGSLSLVLNTSVEEFERAAKAFPSAAFGIHINRHQLRIYADKGLPESVRKTARVIGVSCHDENELAMASRIGADYAFLSPVLATGSHPEAIPLGWRVFSVWVEKMNIPVYALGGVKPSDIAFAQQQGAQGIAAISAFWEETN
jgi:8-oxo-dGTP diphosphatase